MVARHAHRARNPRAMGWCVLLLVATRPLTIHAQESAWQPVLKMAFVSNREHYWYPHVYLYEHDGRTGGKIVGSIQPQDKRLDHQPILARGGSICLYGYEQEGQVGRLQYWDFTNNKALDLPEINKDPNAVFSPSLSEDGRWLAFSAWNRPGATSRWDAFLFDLERNAFIDLPAIRTAESDERRVALSGDGRHLTFTTNAATGQGLTDIRLLHLDSGQVDELREMNSPATDSFPSLSHDGRWLCFASDRPGGSGGLDIYLFDCVERRFAPLPGLNCPGHDQSPSITGDGRYIAFVSERLDGAGEHDIFLYDREQQRLLPTPGLNTARDDYDPCVVVLRSPSDIAERPTDGEPEQ